MTALERWEHRLPGGRFEAGLQGKMLLRLATLVVFPH